MNEAIAVDTRTGGGQMRKQIAQPGNATPGTSCVAYAEKTLAVLFYVGMVDVLHLLQLVINAQQHALALPAWKTSMHTACNLPKPRLFECSTVNNVRDSGLHANPPHTWAD